jgi:hypothetical protein
MKYFFDIFLILFIICIRANTQELPKYEKKMYAAPDGKIYYNKVLPVYFYISVSPDSKALQYLLKSETTPQYANPMYFDMEGKNTLRSPWAVDTVTKEVALPKRDVQFQIYADSKPPKTEIIYDRLNEKFVNGIHYIPDSIKFSLVSKDELSGVENIYISIDNAPYIPYNNTIELGNEKKYTIKYLGLDNTGNMEPLHEIKFYLDKTAPSSTLEFKGEKYNELLSGKSYISIHAKDNISGVKHIYSSIDDSIFHLYTGAINTALLKLGDHKLFYYSSDEVNNKEHVKVYQFYIDNTPPQVIEEVMGKTFIANGKEFSAGTSKLKITSFDNKAGVKEIFYSINNSPFNKYDKPIVLTGYKGNLLIKSYATDNVGNQSQSNLSNSRKNAIPYLDLSAPWIGHYFIGPYFLDRDTAFISHKTKIELQSKDTESGINKIEFQLDSSDLSIYSTPFSVTKEGIHHISAYGYDNTDNMTRQNFEFMVDTVGPEIYERFSTPPIGTIESDGVKLNQYPGQIVVFLSSTDAKSGFENIFFQLNDAPMQPYSKNIKGFVPGKKNVLKIIAIDKLGNRSKKNVEFYIR